MQTTQTCTLFGVALFLVMSLSACGSRPNPPLTATATPNPTDMPLPTFIYTPTFTNIPTLTNTPVSTNTPPLTITPTPTLLQFALSELVISGEDLHLASILAGGDGLDLTPANGCKGKDCIIRVWLIQMQDKVASLIVTLVNNITTEQAMQDLDQSKNSYFDDGYIELEIPSDLDVISEANVLASPDGETILFLSSKGPILIILALQNEISAIDQKIAIGVLSEIAKIQLSNIQDELP